MPRRPTQRRVAIPRRLRLRGRTWKVRLARRVPKSDDGRPGAEVGICDRNKRTIWISSRIARERQEEVLVHETVHALFPPGIVEPDVEERIVEALAPALRDAIASGALSATMEGVG